jgi:hypothetical protein
MESMDSKGLQELKPEKILFVERRPSAHPLFSSLSEYQVQPKETSATEKFQAELRDLEKTALAGDLQAWQEKFPQMTAKAKEANVDPSKDLNTLVQIKKLELTVMLQAAGKAQIAAKQLEGEALRAQMKKDAARSQQLLTQAQKLNHLAEKLKNQLLSKTS